MGGMHQRRNDVLLHTCHLRSDTYWRLGVVLLHKWHLYVICEVTRTEDLVLEEGEFTKDGPWVLRALELQLWAYLSSQEIRKGKGYRTFIQCI